MRRWLPGLLALALAQPAGSYELLKTAGGTPLRWQDQRFPVRYLLNQEGSTDVPLADVQSAVVASFQTWQEVPTARITFVFGGTTAQTRMANDNVNLIRWFDTDFPFDNNSLAVTVNTFNEFSGAILDADIHVNGLFVWATSGAPAVYDIQNVITHEAGHFLGLGHSPVAPSTMFADARPGETTKSTLHADDIEGLNFLYPASGGGGGTTPPLVNPGDVNSSGRVDGQDLILLGTAFGSSRGDSNYRAQADFNRDGEVDGHDLATLAENFGAAY